MQRLNARPTRQTLGFALSALAAATAAANPIVTLDDEDDFLPGEGFYQDNPAAVTNVVSGGFFAVGGVTEPFDFNGTTVNIGSGGQVGSRFTRSYLDNVDLNVTSGKLEDGTTFAGTTGQSNITMSAGTSILRLTMQGNTNFNATGGQIGVNPPGGVPSLIAEGSSIVTIDGASVDNSVQVIESATLLLNSGSIDDFMSVRDDAVVTVAGGVTGRAMHTFDDSTLNVIGGVVGREFAATERSVVNMSGGGMERDGGVFDDAVFNLRGGAVEAGFRAYGGKMNIMGGVVGDFFRLGAPGRNGRDSHAEIFATSASIDGLDVAGSRVITEREGQFLTADLALGGTIGLELAPSGVDRILEEALLTLTIVNDPGDFDGDGLVDAADYTVWRDNLGAEVPLFTLGDGDGSGVVDNADYALWAANYGGSLPAPAMAMAVPEPTAACLTLLGLAGLIGPRRRG